ncbi:MAG: hypothetical protein IM504_23045 [Microcystis sp. M038S2]|jgi:hypothetical protein|uniref:Uncharacterized protein n=1 Tax=Microcystis aeruginosa G11-04 TaxID=2685956 RepID=A0A966FZQ6_MICAE|nr:MULTISPECIES: hypothetical protein [unclassified Microcystis]MCA6509055.1 hypothetical protein [Pseudanabaena sp. M109S1SP2A07QC]NCR26981.1 hypothetical protein [Microcystis aeruginosa LE13-04]NCS09570.1 hypothetical protein [Microcystis aeruginosa G13-07]NCS22967.1 hypothetical protein [Microcystis aeruginosa G11-06]NCS37284.1 hypothetical protein [Microcystis aeruginosa G11-01]NCS50832.1 hypothetical protein [Microcystis aeruginosa BK11-02]NCS57430.1 hypothetical protein [Microcystis ae
MTQAIRQTIFVQSDGRLEIQSDKLLPGRKVEVIIILEDDPAISSAEALAIKRLENLGDPQEWITGVEAEEEIDEDELREWVKSCGY